MANASLDDDEKPLDPAMLRVQAKLRRLMLVGGSTMLIGIAAVLLAIVYRVSTTEPAGLAAGATVRLTLAEMNLPLDARLVSSGVDGGRLALTYAHSGGNTVVLVDAKTMKVAGRLELPTGP